MSLSRTLNARSWLSPKDAERGSAKQEILTDYRTRRALEDEARAQQRWLDLAEQSSDSNTPELRIGTWEKLHALRMPADPEHPILDVIAATTRLKLCDVQAVQAARKRQTSTP